MATQLTSATTAAAVPPLTSKWICDEDLLQRSTLTKCFNTWLSELANDDDATFLLTGISTGFRLIADISKVSSEDCLNYHSATSPDVKPLLDELFRSELQAGRFSEQRSKPLRVNAIGAVPKSGSATPRPITDCSRPFDNPVNSYIIAEPFTFEPIDRAIALSSPGCFYAVVDIKSAYRWVPVF